MLAEVWEATPSCAGSGRRAAVRSVGSGQRWWAPGSWVCSGDLANNVNVSTPDNCNGSTHDNAMAQECWMICCSNERMLD